MSEVNMSFDYESSYKELDVKYRELQKKFDDYKEQVDRDYISVNQSPIDFASSIIKVNRWNKRPNQLVEIAEHLQTYVRNNEDKYGIFR